MNAFEVVQPRPVRGGWSLRGYKGKGGGGGARQPVEAADSLHSTSYARVLDLLSEGEIAGLVNGLQSIYLNNTPLQNADGSFNFAGVTADFRAGFQTQDPIPGFPSAESPVAVGVELKAATPWVRSILNRNLSAVRVTLGVDGLSKANTENGDISGYTVNYAIDLQTDGGAWVEVLAAAFTGKTTQQYRRTHRIDLPTAVTNWTLRVRRVTPNANSNTVADTTVIESITEVIDAKLRYPMSALVGLQVDASQFRGSVPTRAYHCRGRIIRVPSNYDPVMRTYAGIWDGTFKSAYSNNPAWVFYDLATNDRYGLGKRIPAGWINKWSLYQIGVYCDGMVSNGRGGVEPRFTCNAYLQSRGDATRVLQDLCSIFRGMVYWAAGAAVPVADMPRDPAVTYNQGDVIDGRFSYSGSRLKDRHTVALVSYNDMTDFGRQKVVYYQDDAAVARYGIRKVEISAFGCTSEAQALRVGQWAVLTAQRETRSVSFSLGLKGNLCSPGQVIEIADSAFAGRRMGGLVKSATAAKVALDAPVTAQAGDSITVMLPSGVAQSRRIAFLEMIGGAQHVSVNPAFDAAPVAESSWAISTADVAAQLFTVLSVTEGTGPGLTFDVSAIQHEPGKFASIDQGALLPERPVSVVPAQVLPTPIGVTVGAHSVTAADGTVSTTVTASWKAVAGAAFYDVEWSRSQSDWVRMPRTALTAVDIPNAYTGDYLVRVRAISAIDTVSAWGYSAATPVAAKALPPRNYDTFLVAELPSGMRQYSFTFTTQSPPADLAGAEIRYILGSPVNIDWQQMRPLDDGGYYTNSFESTKPEAGLWTFALRARSRSGVLSEGMLIWRGQLLHNVADVVPDLTPPPAPTGVTAMPLMTTAQVNWASPTYTVGHGHDHSVIYAALWATGGTAPAFSAAKSVGTEQGHPASIPVELGSKYTIWVTHVSVDGVESAPSAGVTFVTAQDVGKLLDVLEGKITESQLYTDLAKEIDLISGTGAGSVNARVLAEAQARAQAVAAEATTRAQALASEAAARGQDVAAMAADLQAATDDLQARIDAVNAQVSDIIGASDFDPAQAYEAGQLVKYQNKLYRAKVNTVGNLPTNATYWDLVGDYASLGEAVAAHAAQLADHANRITHTEQGLTAEASARTTLAAQLRGNYTGSDVAQVTSGLVWSERQARVSGDSANASAIDAVKARMPTGTGKVASEASVTDEATARAAADAAAASRTTAIEARLPAGTGSLATAAAVTALDTRVTAAEGVNTSQSTNITNLQNSVTGLQSSKADASALSALDSKVTTQGNTLTSQGQSITALQNSITNGPVLPSDFSAGLSSWTLARQGDPSTVASAAGTIVTNDADFGVCAQFNNWTVAGQNVLTKGLVQAIPGRVYRVRARFKVAAAGGFPLGLNLVAGGNTATYSSGGDAFSSPVSITAAGQIAEVTALFSDKAVNAAGAIAWGATAVLLRFGLRINGNIATGLQLRVQSITLEDATADAANADATTALTSRVTAAEGVNASQSTNITNLQNSVTGLQSGKADASALSALDTKVATQGNTISSQGSAITNLQNSVGGLSGAASNLLKASNIEKVRTAGAYKFAEYFLTEELVEGQAYTLVTCASHTPEAGDSQSYVGAWAAGGYQALGSAAKNGSRIVSVFKFVKSSGFGALRNDISFYYFPSSVKTGAATVHWAALYRGDVVPPKEWQPSILELDQALTTKADASAVSSLQSTVSQQGDTITSQGSSLAALKNTVESPTTGLGSKASSSALTALDSKVTGIDGRLTAETSRIDSLQVSVSEAGGQNLLYNPSFEVAGTGGFADGYVRGGQSAGVATTPTLVVSWLDPLGCAQRLDCTGLGTSLYSDIININNFKPAAVEGQRAAFSVYVRASAGILVRIYVQARASQTSTATLATYAGTLETPGEGGARISLLTPSLPAGTTALHLIFRVQGSGTVSAGFVEWDRAQVELGTTVTAWRDNGVAGLSAVNAAVTTEATARANADTALASRATALESRMPTGTGQLATAAALTAVDTKVTNIDGRVTSESSRLDQVQAAVGSAAAGLQALNPLGGESEWSAVSGPASATFVTAAEPDARGGAVLTVGNASTNGERWLRHVTTIPMDENKLYKLSARFRRTAGDGGIYLGIAGLNAAKTLYVNTSNVETSAISSQHYATNNAKPALGTWQVVEYYFKGRAAGAATGSGTKASPRVFANKVAHLALMIVGNYQGQVGFFDLDYITLEDVTADEQALAAIATEATTRATTDGYLGAQYSVRMQLSQGGQQVVGGFGISGTTSGTAGPQIDFGVMANSFWIAAPSGSPGGVSNVKPFVVQTTAQTVNGVSVPAGVYMDAAYINNVTALWARFGNLVADTIQATSISVTKLTGGNLSVGAWINSSNYVSGSTGWSINSNGQAEFSGVTVRGTIYSSAGTIGGITINGNGLNVGGFWGYVWPPAGQSGLHIGPYGILLGNANNGRYVEIQSSGNIYAPGLRIENGNATFSGNLSGASGTFSGTLTAQRVISMENLDYNIATVAVGVTAADQASPIDGEILGVTAPAADWSATYIVSFHAEVRAGTRGVLRIQVDGGTQFEFSLSEGGMKSFGFTFSGNGLTRRVRLYVAGNNTAPVSSVIARSISVIVSKR